MYHSSTHIHFVGIGGIGMSGIALIFKKMGYAVSGCDSSIAQKSVQRLQAIGIPVYASNNSPQCHDASIHYVVYSSDVSRENPELQAAAQRGILVHRAHMLAELMRRKFSIAISGSHGKTTTTALITHMLMHAGVDPSYAVGGYVHALNSNADLGSGNFFVAEADESDRSFLHLPCALAVVTNIDREHLNTYADIDDICTTFQQFLHNLPFYGKAIICADDPYATMLKLPAAHQKILYGKSEHADVQVQDYTLYPTHSLFTVRCNNESDSAYPVHLALPGEHNILNALAAIAVGRQLDIPLPSIIASLASFPGVERRFTLRGLFQGAEIFDDYGHHPREIECTLAVARNRTKGKLIVVFQPHRFSRTQALWQDFVDLFAKQPVDKLFITAIYNAHEQPIPLITSPRLVQDIKQIAPDKPVAYVEHSKDSCALKEAIASCVTSGDLVLFIGAGDIYHLGQELATPEH